MNVHKVLESAHVERYHTMAHIKNQTNDRHGWAVAILCQHFDPNCRKEVILAAMTHDSAELETGDNPAPVKWANPELKEVLDKIEHRVNTDWGIHYELTPDEKLLLKVSDYIEGMQYCFHRVMCGELSASIIFDRFYDRLNNHIGLDYDQRQFVNRMRNRMAEINHGEKE